MNFNSAFWGQSFVSELSRLAEAGKKSRSGSNGDLDEGVDLKADEKADEKAVDGTDDPVLDKVNNAKVDEAEKKPLPKAATA